VRVLTGDYLEITQAEALRHLSKGERPIGQKAHPEVDQGVRSRRDSLSTLLRFLGRTALGRNDRPPEALIRCSRPAFKYFLVNHIFSRAIFAE